LLALGIAPLISETSFGQDSNTLIIPASNAPGLSVSDAPILSKGDKWVYNMTEEKNRFRRNKLIKSKIVGFDSRDGSQTVAVSAKPIDSNMPPKELLRDSD